MNVTTIIERKLKHEPINWDEILALLPQTPKESSDRLLLAFIKRVDVPLDIVTFACRNAKLKTLRKAFDQACYQESMSTNIITRILDEMMPIASVTIRELCLYTALRSNRSYVADILMKMEGGFLTSYFAAGTFQESDDFDKLADMILKSDVIASRKDIFSNSNIIHQFVMKGRADIVEWIINTLPTSVQTQDENKNLPLHYALECKHFSMASTLFEKGTQLGLKIGGLLVKNRWNESPITYALTSHAKAQRSSSETQNIANVLQWLQSKGLLSDAFVVHDVIKFSIENNCDDMANRLYKESVQNNVKGIESIILTMMKEMIKERKFNYDTVVRFIHTNSIKNEKNWMGPVFHRSVADQQIDHVKILLISHPNLLQSKDKRGRLPIHRACSFICDESIPLINLLFEEAQKRDGMKLKHAGMFEPDENGKTPFDILFSHFEFNSLEMNIMIYKVLQQMLNIDTSLPVVPYVLQQTYCFEVLYEHLLHNGCVQWDPLARYHGQNALFYAIKRMVDKRDDKVDPFLELCYDSNSQWHACLEAKDDEGQLPLHYALRCRAQVPNRIIFNLVSSSLKSLGEIDGVSGLYPALLGAVYCDLGTIYELLRSYSQIIQS